MILTGMVLVFLGSGTLLLKYANRLSRWVSGLEDHRVDADMNGSAVTGVRHVGLKVSNVMLRVSGILMILSAIAMIILAVVQP